MRKSFSPLRSVVVLALLCGACGTDLELTGQWEDQFSGPTEISSTTWGPSSVASFDNEANWAVLQAPADDEYNPNKFSKVLWIDVQDGAFFYCTVEFGKDTAADAEASTKTADSSNPAETGCGGEFPWTKMTAASEG